MVKRHLNPVQLNYHYSDYYADGNKRYDEYVSQLMMFKQ